MPATRRWPKRAIALAGTSYLFIAVVLWWNAWSGGASTHTLCGCGDPALFLWFFQWPATAVAHGQNPFYATTLFHPGGMNLLAQTSVLGVSVPLIPVTWIFGPVASLNVAATLTPALSAFAAFMVLRRWVQWVPAAYLGGLLYGFSPFVLTSLQFAHLMTAAVMLLPLILAVLVEILVDQQHNPRQSGLLLGVLLCAQFFLSSELLAITAMLVVVCLLVFFVVGWCTRREELRRSLPHALTGLVVGALAAGVLLAYPVWFALEGPAHLSGLIWPDIGAVGGFIGSSFVNPTYIHGANIYTALGGYEGRALPSAGYLGWGLLGVLLVGSCIWFRDRRLWFYGFVLAFCMVCSLGARRGQWEPSRVFGHLPVLDDVIEQRFMLFGFLAAAVMLALLLDHVRQGFTEQRIMGVSAALAVAAVALVPIAATFGSTLPFAMRAVVLPRWYSSVAPHLPPGRVLLSYPAPFSGIQVTMAWQAVNGISYSQAGGGGPQGVSSRSGSARAGFLVLSQLAFGVDTPPPAGTSAELAAVRHAIAVWKVNTVVIAPQAVDRPFLQGRDPTYAAGFMTAALGRLPSIEAGAWVWNDVAAGSGPRARPAARISPARLSACVLRDQGHLSAPPATLRVPRCVLAKVAS